MKSAKPSAFHIYFLGYQKALIMIKCVVPISGGKDSQLCGELAIKKFNKDEILFLFCDTGYEHPITYKHIDTIERLYNVQVLRLHSDPDAVYQLIRKTGCFPTDMMRFCTNELKINRSKFFYSMLARLQGEGFEVWYGMRLGESAQRSERYKNHSFDVLYHPHEMLGNYPKYLGKIGVRFRLPILELEEEDVYEVLGDRKNPLYDLGFDRVGCFPCLAGGDKWKEKAFNFDDVGRQRKIEVLQLGVEIGKNIFTSIGVLRKNIESDVQGVLQERDNVRLSTNMCFSFEDEAPCHICNI